MNPRDIFSRAFDILVEHAGVQDFRDWQRETFIRDFAEGTTTEWRFQGLLGFGGKFWRNNNHYYITCYPEDRTPERETIIAKVNELLKELPFFHP